MHQQIVRPESPAELMERLSNALKPESKVTLCGFGEMGFVWSMQVTIVDVIKERWAQYDNAVKVAVREKGHRNTYSLKFYAHASHGNATTGYVDPSGLDDEPGDLGGSPGGGFGGGGAGGGFNWHWGALWGGSLWGGTPGSGSGTMGFGGGDSNGGGTIGFGGGFDPGWNQGFYGYDDGYIITVPWSGGGGGSQGGSGGRAVGGQGGFDPGWNQGFYGYDDGYIITVPWGGGGGEYGDNGPEKIRLDDGNQGSQNGEGGNNAVQGTEPGEVTASI